MGKETRGEVNSYLRGLSKEEAEPGFVMTGAADHRAMLWCQPSPSSINTMEEIPWEESVYFFLKKFFFKIFYIVVDFVIH